MKKGFVKWVSFVSLALTLFFFNVFPAFAATNKMMPYDYIFLMASSACGLSVSEYCLYQLESAFVGYLETHNQAMLSQVKSYESLSWEDTVTDIDSFLSVYRDWLSLIDFDADKMDLPTSPFPPFTLRDVGIWGESNIRFTLSDNPYPPPANFGDCTYIITDVARYSDYCYERDVYISDVSKEDVFVVLDSRSFRPGGQISFNFYQRDSSSSSGFELASLKNVTSFYDFNFSDTCKSRTFIFNAPTFYTGDIRSILDCPFKVFSDEASLEAYIKEGNDTSLFKDGFSLVNDGTLFLDSSIEDIFLEGVLNLPSSYDEAIANYNNLLNVRTLRERVEHLKEAGLDVSYSVSYTVEHYKQNVDGETFTKEEDETLSGLFESEATFTPKTYSGFTFAESLTEPDNEILIDDSLTIKLYYLRDLISYTVEHYKQQHDASGKESWVLADTDLLSGLFDTDATFTAKEYSGFTYDASLTDSNKILASDRTLTVKLYYTQNTVPYTVEHYKQSAIKGTDGSSSFTLAERETLSGLPGMEADCPKKNYAGLFYDSSLTEPADRRILSDGSLVIKMYYTQDLFGFLKEPLDSAVGKILIISAALLPFTLIALFSIRFFKRIISKA